MKVGDLVYVSYELKKGLAWVTGCGDLDTVVRYIGEEQSEEFGNWHLHKNHPEIDKLREYFNPTLNT